jgi:hypothetical protein
MKAKEVIPYEDFLANVPPYNLDFINSVNDFMLQNGCAYKIEAAKNGHVLSYLTPKTKKVLLNYVFRKNGMVARIYGDGINKYAEVLVSLPENMAAAIEKSPVCKRLIDPAACNSRCSMGYAFTLKGGEHKKCRYNSFMFEIKEENYTAIRLFIENELRERTA